VITEVFDEYRRIFRTLNPLPRSALEVGALPTSQGLLTCDELQAVPQKVGISLTKTGTYRGVGVKIMDARKMTFKDNTFDLVVSSSTLEHVPDFWIVCDEMKRVLAPSGLLIVNVPGYGESKLGNKVRGLAFRLGLHDLLKRTTVTMRIHDAPHDYYRFSIHTFRDVVMSGLVDVKIWSVLKPPRIFGTGRKARL